MIATMYLFVKKISSSGASRLSIQIESEDKYASSEHYAMAGRFVLYKKDRHETVVRIGFNLHVGKLCIC